MIHASGIKNAAAAVTNVGAEKSTIIDRNVLLECAVSNVF